MASNTAAPPVALNQENIDDLICSICLTVPTDPQITPCDHMFCRACIRQALNHNNLCPIDRRPCTVGQLKQLEGLSLRVWSGIQVKCGGHESGCAWRGSIADYSAHVENNCSVGRNRTGQNNNNNAELMEELETLRRENIDLKRQMENVKEGYRELSDYLRRSRDALQEQLNSRPNLPRIFHGSYDFGPENVRELSQLISRYLDNKPRDIDSNKIYNCVRKCYIALDRNYDDNPGGYWYDVRMLLATCLNSQWFTAKQLDNIDDWHRKHFGRDYGL